MRRGLDTLLVIALAALVGAGAIPPVADALPPEGPIPNDVGYVGGPIEESRTDVDGDGLFDSLVLRVPFVINESGRFWLRASLFVNNIGAVNGTEAELSPGTHVVAMSIPGWRIRLTRSDGPHAIDVSMYNPDTSEYVNRTHRSSPYDWRTFEFLAEIQDGFAERPVDANDDGLFNYLEIRGILNVSVSRNYTLSASLISEHTSEILASASSFRWWSVGVWEFVLRFPGNQIRMKNFDGPYQVVVELAGDYYYDMWQRESFPTHYYRASDFHHEPIAFRGTWSDRAVDLDGNVLPDVLRIEIPITVTIAGLYHIYGYLEGPRYFRLEAARDANFTTSDWNTTLDFDGFSLRDSCCGETSFVLTLAIVEDVSPYWIQTSGPTTVYDPYGFDNPYANWIPGLTLRAVDADGDGLFDELRLNATFRAKVATRFTVNFWAALNYSAYLERFVTVTAGPGLVDVGTAYPGWRLRATRANGTYLLAATLSAQPTDEGDPSGHSLETVSTSANFTYDQFAPALRLRETLRYRLVDNDGDGMANQLVMTAPVHVNAAGPYTFQAFMGNGSVFSSKQQLRFLEPGDVDVEFRFSGFLMRQVPGDAFTYLSASLPDRWYTVDVFVASGSYPIPDPAIFQDLPTKTVAFTADLGGPDPCCNPIRVLLVNYSNGYEVFVDLPRTGASATIPDLDYTGIAGLSRHPDNYVWTGKVAAPLPSNVVLEMTRLERGPYIRDHLDVELSDWSIGYARLNRTLAGDPYDRLRTDLGYEPDGYVTSEEIRNRFRFLYYEGALGVSLSVDGEPVFATRAGPDDGFGAGPVEAREWITLSTPWSLSLRGGFAHSHTVRVQLPWANSYFASSARFRMPLGWNVTDAKTAPGVVVSGLGTAEVVLLVTENHSELSEAVLTATYSGRFGRLAARVFGVAGTPAAGVRVTLLAAGSEVASVLTTPDGRFLVPGLPAGSYELRMEAAGYSPVTRTVRIRPDESLDLGDILLHPMFPQTGSLLGRILDDAGTSVGNASVVLLELGAGSVRTSSGSDGRFHLDGIPPGTHTLRIESPGYLPILIPVQVLAGQRTDLHDLVVVRRGGTSPLGNMEPWVLAAALAGAGIGAISVVVMVLRRRSRRNSR